jgi:hypothetical protein
MAGIQLPPMQAKGGNNSNTAESMYDATGQLKIKTLSTNNGLNPKEMGGNNFNNNSKNLEINIKLHKLQRRILSSKEEALQEKRGVRIPPTWETVRYCPQLRDKKISNQLGHLIAQPLSHSLQQTSIAALSKMEESW